VSASAFKEEHSLAIADGEVRVVVRQPTYRRGERSPACAIVFGEPTDGCLVRVHSKCLYGDVFGSQECDCGAQLRTAIEMMKASGSGVFIYLEQEGRGAGLFNKARACRLREQQGIDSFRSYEHYGLPPDARSYEIAGDLLKDLGLQRVTLLTNNWEKVAGLEGRGIKVDREPLVVPISSHAVAYMESKRARGHELGPIHELL
jgi:3,4-dihydroxy 2-butanone 4-phosphate synthase/GTP cyclohydrolase II